MTETKLVGGRLMADINNPPKRYRYGFIWTFICCFFGVMFALGLGVAIYAFADGKIGRALFFLLLAIVPVEIWARSALDFTAISIDDDSITSYVFGRKVKSIRWRDVRQIERNNPKFDLFRGYRDFFYVFNGELEIARSPLRRRRGPILVHDAIADFHELWGRVSGYARRHGIPVLDHRKLARDPTRGSNSPDHGGDYHAQPRTVSSRCEKLKEYWAPDNVMARSIRRATPWLLLQIPLPFLFILPLAFWLGRKVNSIQYIFAKPETIYCEQHLISGAIFIIVSFLAAVPIGFMFANICMWLIPPARPAMDKSGPFSQSMKQLTYATLAITPLSLALLLCLININTCYTPTEIIKKSFIFSKARSYDISKLESVYVSCRSGDNLRQFTVRIRAKDRTEFQFQQATIWEKVPIAEIMATLEQIPIDYSGVTRSCPTDLLAKLPKGAPIGRIRSIDHLLIGGGAR